jgi:hypothetical protein
MKARTISLTLLACLSLPAPALLLGCSGSERNTQIDSSRGRPTMTLPMQLKAIDDDPHMPPEAKQTARALILQHANRRSARL